MYFFVLPMVGKSLPPVAPLVGWESSDCDDCDCDCDDCNDCSCDEDLVVLDFTSVVFWFSFSRGFGFDEVRWT